jgi:predicted nuclease with RNAse H fold
MTSYFVGIDIQVRRNCCYAVIDDDGNLIGSGWLSTAIADAIELVEQWSESGPVQVGIDAPRTPLDNKRKWYWKRNQGRWDRRSTQKGYGRHCEIVISAHRIANPQWTPVKTEAPEWMSLGFKLYSALESSTEIYEVFPTASYALLQGNSDVRINIDFSACKPGPKDMLDAWVAAVTVREFIAGRGTEVGGGDGLGTIILPRPLPEPVIKEVLVWPE